MEIKHVSNEFVNALIEKYDLYLGCNFEESEKGCFYTIEENKYICVDNSTCDCWVEEFKTIEATYLYFKSKFTLDELYEIDNLINELRKELKQ